ncbi:Interferon-induced very large GTPase 1 [Myotis brandtii]|uniref:Interferon-induced very large GTPase 1 n=1 Tax=Myotis brandtii TaxID=109478 RepID=S7PH71_MYOBR|nr:Interferon-induced very large GTPase 1 [Myotis brandtii]
MEGVVEISWFCPGGDDEDRFDNCVTFTNLHGDAKEHKKQLTFLQEVSSLIVVLMSTSDDDEENRKIVRDLSQSPRPLICLLDNKEQTMANNSNKKVMIGIRNRNEAELTEELVTTIRRLMELSNIALSLEDLAPMARKQGFLIDEDQRECKEAKEKADVLMALLRELNISQVKENLLPLQGHLWHLWCKKDKELYHLREKGNQSIEQHKSEIETEKQRIRRQQLTRALPLNDLMQAVLEILQNNSETQTTHYFLQWLSVLLDNLTAEHLEQLNEKKNNLWSRIQTEKQKAPKSTDLQGWQKEIEAISTEISDCTLGIEQLLREVGQIYEALEEASPTEDTIYLSLPQIAADLMISGAPIELMDGDASYVPLNHNVQDLKRRILMAAKQELRGSIMRTSDVKLRVQDLWRALVNENFIFSFRNTREVMAMSKLETMYNSWTWELRSYVLDLQNQLINQIMNGKIQELTLGTLEDPVTEKYKAIQQELDKYFNEDPDNEILIQWKASFENKLINLKEALIFESKNKAEGHISYKKNQEILDNKKSGYEKELLERSRELALTVKDKELSEEELHVKFNQLWEKWVFAVTSTLPSVTEPDIDVDSENILLDYFKKETDVVNILKKKSRKEFEINYEKHVKMRKRFGLITRNLEVYDKESIKRITDCIVSRYTEMIKNLQRLQCDYNPSYFHEILNIIEEGVKSAPTEERYTFTSKYKIDLSLCLFQGASENFKDMHRAFKRANDPRSYLESKKDDFFMSFKISCQGASSIKTFVDFLWHKLTPAISNTIWEQMAPKIAGDMRATCPAFNGNRANLEKHILISLAENEKFDDYWKYLHNPESYFKDYIQNYIKKYCSEQNNKIKTFLKISVGDIKNVILSAIHESTARAKDKSSTVSGWLDLFCGHLGNNLNFPRKDLVSIEHQEIKDIEFLKEAMNKALDPAMITVEQECMSMPVEDRVPEIQKMLSEHLCGCWKQCPFCGAICTNTIPNHDGDHSVPFHRPNAVIGWRYSKTEVLCLNICTSSVASDDSFTTKSTSYLYKTYRQAGGEYATWSITPDTSTQPYWKWFVCHFRSNLEEKYKKKFTGRGEIPDAWTKITKEDVLDDLEKQ